MRPINPSIGTAFSQRQFHGSNARNDEKNTTSAVTPAVFAIQLSTLCERNHRRPSIPITTGNRKAAMPMNCKSMSLENAPKTPIQLCAGLPDGGVADVFSDGSIGEYEASARNRRV